VESIALANIHRENTICWIAPGWSNPSGRASTTGRSWGVVSQLSTSPISTLLSGWSRPTLGPSCRRPPPAFPPPRQRWERTLARQVSKLLSHSRESDCLVNFLSQTVWSDRLAGPTGWTNWSDWLFEPTDWTGRVLNQHWPLPHRSVG